MDIREIEDWAEEAEEALIFQRSDKLNEIGLQRADKETLHGEFMKLQLKFHNLTERQKRRKEGARE